MDKVKEKLINCIKLEIDLMGDLADTTLPQLHYTCNTPRIMLGQALWYLTGTRPSISDVCSFITKCQECLVPVNHKSAFEFRLRLIELVWKIESEWRFIDNTFEFRNKVVV